MGWGSFWRSMDFTDPRSVVRTGLRAVSGDATATDVAAAYSPQMGASVDTILSRARPKDDSPEAPKNDYDIADAMVQAARRMAGRKATQGFGLAQTFRTRRLDATGGPGKWDTGERGALGKKELGGEGGGSGDAGPIRDFNYDANSAINTKNYVSWDFSKAIAQRLR